FMPVLDICKFEQVVMKTQGSITRTTFSPLYHFVVMVTRFLTYLSQNYMQSIPNPTMLHIKLDQDWPDALRGIRV
ncbi:MAG: hypothetical protein ACH254_22090, partial [Candidatus Thiodiazotropha endolucinida]